MFRALSVRNYRLYATGQIISTTGTWMARVTQDWLVYHILTNDNSFALGIITALQFLPSLIFGMYGGVLGDRYPKRKVLVCTQAAMAFISLVTGVLLATGAMRLWSIGLIAVTFGIASAIDSPVRQAFVVEMVGRDTVQNAVSLNSATFNMARLVGPAIAGVLIEAFGTAPSFFANAVSYLVVIGCLLAMSTKDLHLAQRVRRARGQFLEGVKYVRGDPRLLLPIVLLGVVSMFGINFQITNALIAQGVFHKGAGAYGILSTMQAVGSVGGALLAARRKVRPRMQLLVGAALVFGLLEAASAFMPSYLLFMLMLVPTGLTVILLTTATNTTLQLTSVSQMQGRVMAMYTTVFLGTAPVGSLLIGWLGGAFGPRAALFFGGAISAVAAAIIGLSYAKSQGIALPSVHRLGARPAPANAEFTQELLVTDAKSA